MNVQYCTACGQSNAETANFCGNCGNNLSSTLASEKAYLGIWMRRLRERIQEDHQSNNLDDYLNHFYASGFNKTFMSMVEQTANEVQEKKNAGELTSLKKEEDFVTSKIDQILDFFIIHHCKDINQIPLSERILKLQDTTKATLEFPKIIAAYLNIDLEPYPFYIDFSKMPVEQLRNASMSFLFPEMNEKIWLIVDTSELDNCKEGFAITEKGIYWKAPFEKAKAVHFTNLESIKREEQWLLINSLFFNTNASLNLKMMYLLRKLKIIFNPN